MIRHLSQELINKIAAGEVVERPSSVVKELVENSIDAGSTEIIVTIAPGLIQVTDNGDGIEKDDLLKLFTNHSTSKIISIEDLNSIHTMGFRGEAIATISSVSKMEIQSRYKGSEVGYSIIPDGKPTPTPMNPGTIIYVKDLFFNVPARKKFMKSESQENRYIMDTFTRISLVNYKISFKLIINDKVIYNFQSSTIKDRLKSIAPNIEFIPIIEDDIISGFISQPKDSFSKSTYQYMFANNRYITPTPSQAKAVLTGYKNALMRGQYPPFVIFINVNPTEIDVNVHPRKTEVKFENDGYIFQKIYSTIQHTLFKEDINYIEPQLNNSYQEKNENTKPFEINDRNKGFVNFKRDNKNELFKSTEIISRAMNFSSEILNQIYDPLETLDISNARQYSLSYITAQNAEGLLIFDQHACSERFVFETLKEKFEKGDIKPRRMLIPEKVPIEFSDYLFDKRTVLQTFGIEIENIDKEIFIVSLPDFATLRIVDQLYAEIKYIFDDDLTSVLELREKIFTTLACHSAIRFGDKLSDDECKKILKDLLTCKNKLTCPHGRPTYHALSKDKLVQIFKR